MNPQLRQRPVAPLELSIENGFRTQKLAAGEVTTSSCRASQLLCRTVGSDVQDRPDILRTTRNINIFKQSRRPLICGILLIILGGLAVASFYIGGVTFSMATASLLILAGVGHVTAAFNCHGAVRFRWRLLVALAYEAMGVYLVFNPFLTVGSLIFVLGALFVSEVSSCFNRHRIMPCKGDILVRNHGKAAMSPEFDIGACADRFHDALSTRYLRYTEDRRLLVSQFLHTEKPVTLPELERAFLKSYRSLNSSEKLRLPGRILQTLTILASCGLATVIEPEIPEQCSSCLHSDNLTVGTKRWHCWRCGASRCLQPRFVPTNGARMRVDDKCVIWCLGPSNVWSVWARIRPLATQTLQ